MSYGDLGGSARVPAGAADYFRTLPEVEDLIRLYGTTETFVINGEPIKEEQFYYADSSFFDVFSFSLLQGNPQTDRA